MKKYIIIETEWDKRKKERDNKNTKIDKKLKKQRRNQQRFINDKAKELQNNIPKSEHWFKGYLKGNGYDSLFLSNIPLNTKIPDYISIDLRIVIEVDGSIHQTEEIKNRDKLKDEFYKQLNYTLIRVVAYDNPSALQAIAEIKRMLIQGIPY